MSHSYDMYGVGNKDNDYVMFLRWEMEIKFIVVIILKCIEILDHYIVHPSLNPNPKAPQHTKQLL